VTRTFGMLSALAAKNKGSRNEAILCQSLGQIAAPMSDGNMANPAWTTGAGVGHHDDGTVDVTCWCDRKVVRVPLPDIRDGRTASCGRPGCTEPHPG
jgi:hypothetical protein